jgi:F-type H+-transporting ATPase subunit delta
MRDRKVATRYAEALLIAAREAGQVGEIAESYVAVREWTRGNRDLRTFLEAPQVPVEEKKQLLRRILTDRVEELLINFIMLLIDKGRIEYFGDIGGLYAVMVEKEQGYERAVVTTAVELPPDLAQQLEKRLEGATGAKIILKKKVDPAVIGGVCVTMGDKILDGTVRTNLDQLRKTLREAPLR